MKIAVVGSREFKSLDSVSKAVELFTGSLYPDDVIVVSGGAPGVDTCAEQTALALGLPVLSLRVRQVNPDEFCVDEWRMHRGRVDLIPAKRHDTWGDWKSAAFWRNKLMAARCDSAIVFWDGFSRGTSDMIDALMAEQKDHQIIRP